MRLGKSDFKGTNGWLEKWKKRHHIKRVTICGESGDVCGDTVASWKERLPEILNGYAKEDIYNLDETGCFWSALPDKGFGEKGKKCKGGKKAKHCVTVAFLVSAAGEKEDPIVIWTSKTPRCFRGVVMDSLPVKYFHQKKAWMTGDILHKILPHFNHKMIQQKRSVLLFMDNAGCHPKDKYSNIKAVFLLPNTTSKLQPLDLGVIQNFKVHYRQLLLRFVLASIDSCSLASEVHVAGSINILTAIRWISQAWKEVKPLTISKCYKKAGILTEQLNVTSVGEDTDPFEDLDSQFDLEGLISRTMSTTDKSSAEVYINGDHELPTCAEFNDETWDQTFLECLSEQTSQNGHSVEDEESDTKDIDLLPPPLKIVTFKEAIDSLQDVTNFLESRSCFYEATDTSCLIDRVAMLHSVNARQSTLDEYF